MPPDQTGKMAVSELLNTLHGELSASAKVLVDSNKDEFKVALQRRSDTDKKVPGAIVIVASEEDIVKTVCATPPSRINYTDSDTTR